MNKSSYSGKNKIEQVIDDSIINVNEQTYSLAIYNETWAYHQNFKNVPKWEEEEITFSYEIENASKAQQNFYFYFRERFYNGEQINLEGNSNYAFILFFYLLFEYKIHKNLTLLQKQFNRLINICPKIMYHTVLALEKLKKKQKEEAMENRSKNMTTSSQPYAFDPNSYRLGNKYRRKINLNQQEVNWLNKFPDKRNAFTLMEGCAMAVMKQYVFILTEINKRLHKTNIRIEMQRFAEKLAEMYEPYHSDSFGYGDIDYNYYDAEEKVYLTVFRRVENSVREIYGHKRKVSTHFPKDDKRLAAKFENRLGKIFDQFNQNRIIIIGLSATIGKSNYSAVKKFTGDISTTKILLDDTKKETDTFFKYFYHEKPALSLPFLKDLYRETCQNKVLIFPNSRGRTEEIAVKLKKIATKVRGHKNYYTHHSSVDKDIRESIEYFAKNNERYNFCICCTSTLELGIDIGTVDKIVQVDSTHSVASLVQRVGRSGRKEGDKSVVHLYTTNPWSFLQALACWQLYQSNFLEPVKVSNQPFDLLLHQMLSTVKQLNGCKKIDLIQRLKSNHAFHQIEEKAINEIIDHCISTDFLELIQHELFIGLEGELIVNSREFYSVFKTETNFKVIYSGKNIGEIGFSPQVQIDQNILLSAKIWKIIFIDYKRSIVEVIPAVDGNSPNFSGDGVNIHPEIRAEMLRILKSNISYPELNEESQEVLEEMRADFKGFKIEDFESDRPVIIKEDKIVLYAFTGTKINKSLGFLIGLTNIHFTVDEYSCTYEIGIAYSQFKNLLKEINTIYANLDFHLTQESKKYEGLMSFSKWGKYLPLKYKCAIVKERYFDFESAVSFINNLNLVLIEQH